MDVADEWVSTDSIKISRRDAKSDLTSNYKNPSHPLAFMGIDKIYRYYNGILGKREIKQFLASVEAYSLMKQEKVNPQRIWTPIVSFHYLDLGKKTSSIKS